ncbi:MAG: WYL domain-containing protein [Oscillospiraceae bacterium]|nr:WYL domain-containing protein [Oscillospiraceae bacterium]
MAKSKEIKRKTAGNEQANIKSNKADLKRLKQIALDEDKNEQFSLNKVNILLALEVLRKYSDVENKLTRKKIASYIKDDYGISIDEHTLGRNLKELNRFYKNKRVVCSRAARTNSRSGNIDVLYSDFYYHHDFSESEVRLLIDGLLSSKCIPYDKCEALIKKIGNLSGEHVKSSYALPKNRPENKMIFHNIKVILRAMSNRKKIRFHYMSYGTDKQPHIKLKDDGTKRRYIASPYEIVIANGIYYLICSHDFAKTLFHYRIDYMCDVSEIKYDRRSIREIPGHSRGLDLTSYMKQRPYMMSGSDVFRVIFRADKHIVGHILDWFGNDAEFSNITNDTVDVAVFVNEQAMRYWVLQYGEHVEVLQPLKFRKSIGNVITEMAKKYRKP